MNNFNSNIYVDTSALLNWKSKIQTINNDSIDLLNKIDRKMEELDSCMSGNIAEGVKQDINRLTKKSLTFHESMKDLESMLTVIVDKKTNQ